MTDQELLKAYSAYLPYGVKVVFDGEELEHSLVGLDTTSTPLKLISSYGDYGQASFEFSKLILRPLSDLTNEIEHNGEKFVPIEWLQDKFFTLTLDKQCEMIIEDERWINQCDYLLIQYLLEWHFDIYGLLDQNLAINLNEVK